MMHQSSLGGLFLIAKSKMFPLWWSPLLPLYFLISSFFVGSAMVYVESDLARRNYAHTIDQNIMLQLTRVGGRIMLVYLALKLFDITRQGQWGLVLHRYHLHRRRAAVGGRHGTVRCRVPRYHHHRYGRLFHEASQHCRLKKRRGLCC